jgi:hypothetical protein
MAALAVFQTSAFAGSAELAAVILFAFGHACAGFNRAITIGMGTRFFSHDYYLRTGKRQLTCHNVYEGREPACPGL